MPAYMHMYVVIAVDTHKGYTAAFIPLSFTHTSIWSMSKQVYEAAYVFMHAFLTHTHTCIVSSIPAMW